MSIEIGRDNKNSCRFFNGFSWSEPIMFAQNPENIDRAILIDAYENAEHYRKSFVQESCWKVENMKAVITEEGKFNSKGIVNCDIVFYDITKDDEPITIPAVSLEFKKEYSQYRINPEKILSEIVSITTSCMYDWDTACFVGDLLEREIKKHLNK